MRFSNCLFRSTALAIEARLERWLMRNRDGKADAVLLAETGSWSGLNLAHQQHQHGCGSTSGYQAKEQYLKRPHHVHAGYQGQCPPAYNIGRYPPTRSRYSSPQ